MPVYNDQEQLDMTSAKEFKLDAVITHTAPSFCELILKDGLTEWAELDPDIPSDCAKERETMDQIFTIISNHPDTRCPTGITVTSTRAGIPR
jgi:hypothetical protein